MNAPTLGLRTGIALVTVAVIALAGAAIAVLRHTATITVTAHFAEAVAVYPGDDVRVLGVPVGKIESITPDPAGSTMVLSIDNSVKVPADAKAALISPSLVSVRYIQIVPAYHGGPTLADGATIPEQRTATPIEFDDMKSQLTRLAGALGPTGVGKTGALGRALDTVAANLGGQGTDIHDSIEKMSKAAQTFANGNQDLFATVRNLNDFLGALNQNDQAVRAFMNQLSGFSDVANDNTRRLGLTMDSLDTMLDQLQHFVSDNRPRLKSNVDALEKLTKAVSKNRQTFADLAQFAPTTLGSAYNVYSPVPNGLLAQINDPFLRQPAQLMCDMVLNLGGSPSGCQSLFAPLADMARMDHALPFGANPVQRNGTADQEPGAAPLKDPRWQPGRSETGPRRAGTSTGRPAGTEGLRLPDPDNMAGGAR
jgi:phospholipid/cholesterol/gamma-HCH transport system substrate-binding protein